MLRASFTASRLAPSLLGRTTNAIRAPPSSLRSRSAAVSSPFAAAAASPLSRVLARAAAASAKPPKAAPAAGDAKKKAPAAAAAAAAAPKAPAAPKPARYAIDPQGPINTEEWRLFITTNGKRLSPWHDIALVTDTAVNKTAPFSLLNYVNEIPKGTRAKMEVATKEDGNPIKQDIKKGKLRFFGYGDIPFNYGCFPQTFEDPNTKHPDTGCVGDNDPIDVVEISNEAIPMGAVVPVRVLGVMALLDEGETDWKILAVAQNSPLYKTLKDSTNIPEATVTAVREWFRNYKTADGKPQNKFAFDEKLLDRTYALKVVQENHKAWADLVKGVIAAKGLALPKAASS